jgi:hypothetical protein
MGLFDRFNKQEPKVDDWLSKMPKEFTEMMLEKIKSNPQACSLDEIPQGIGRFGLDKTNPIPVYGLPSNNTYLQSLRTQNGELLRFRRNGSIDVSNIVNLVDEYEIYNSSGDIIAILYLSSYHWKTSRKAPQGFRIL